MTLTKDIIRLNDRSTKEKRKRNRTQKIKLIKTQKFSKNSQKTHFITPSKLIKNPFPKGRDFLCRNFLFQKGFIALQDS